MQGKERKSHLQDYLFLFDNLASASIDVDLAVHLATLYQNS